MNHMEDEFLLENVSINIYYKQYKHYRCTYVYVSGYRCMYASLLRQRIEHIQEKRNPDHYWVSWHHIMSFHYTCNNFPLNIYLYDRLIHVCFPPEDYKLHETRAVSDCVYNVSLASPSVSSLNTHLTNVLKFNGVSKGDWR